MSPESEKTCFRCGDPLTFCQCAAEYDERRAAFMREHGRAPTPDEMFQLQPETALEAQHRASRRASDNPDGGGP